ncbi:hypothetical protein ACLKA6_010698 [Drosophila palustris]
MFNRIEKVGSQSMTKLLGELGNLHGYTTYRNEIPPHKKPLASFDEETTFAEELMELEEPGAYVEHTNWINFTAHDLPRPIYINLVRHPIQKVMSAYYYQRHPMVYGNSLLRNPNKVPKNKEYFDRSFNDCVRQRIAPDCVFDPHSPYNNDWRRFALRLCGNKEVCMNLNSEITTQIAKSHVEKEYAVVGSWEDTNITLAVLEAYIPRFFADATKVYYSTQEKFMINATPHDKHLDEDVEAYLKQQFAYEIELYNFCKQRLYKQYIAIRKTELMQEFILQLNPNELNNTKKAEIDVLFYNRVPKTGSIQFIELMRLLGKVHDYDVEKDPQNGGIIPILEPADESDWIENIVNLEDGTVFASHVNYLNFSKYEQPRPIYINMVRDPVERVISWYYYIRAPWVFVPGRRRTNREMPNPQWVNTEFDQCVLNGEKVCTYIEGSLLEKVGDHRRQTLFFCGHNEFKCTPFNSRLALQLAKQNVEREYAVVGTWEHTNETLAVLEAYIPRYFADASKMYYSGLHAGKSNDNPMKPHIRQEIVDMVRRNFTREIEFYQFCRQRLHKQYLALKLNDLMRMDDSLINMKAANELAIRDYIKVSPTQSVINPQLPQLQLQRLSAERLNNTRNAEIDVLFFNRAAKVGSEALLELFNALVEYNDELILERSGLREITLRQLKKREQREAAEFVAGLDEGTVYIRHINWLDFDEFDLPKPIYINMVRDPVERVISWFYYARSSYKNAIEYRKSPNKKIKPESWYKKNFNECVRSGDPECQYVPHTVKDAVPNFKRQSLFYCGHHDDCIPFNSPAAIQMAKEHVERDYAVVGSWEDTNITLTVFERYIPRFFRGAKLMYEMHNNKITNRNKNKRKPYIEPEVKEMIRSNFTHEYEFYHFCKQRLYKQYLALNLQELDKHGLLK